MNPLDISPEEAERFALIACGYVAGSVPMMPPAEWFQDPRFNEVTPITVHDDGRVSGHIAAWGTDHIGMAGGTRAPRSRSGYAYFHTGVIRTDDGIDIPVGQLTLAGGHAALSATAIEAVQHYDSTESAIADVHAGEDRYGIWVSGSLRPDITPEKVRAFRASAPSGDWRPINGRLELVAVCQVNVPGFPVPRARVASGAVMALVAAGAPQVASLQAELRTTFVDHDSQFASHSVEELTSLAASASSVFESADRAELKSRASAISEKISKSFSSMGYTEPSESERLAMLASAERARSVFATKSNKPTKEEREDREAKYTPDTQPRASDGRFRQILARLEEDLAENPDEDVISKIAVLRDADEKDDVEESAKAAVELISAIDRIESGALDGDRLNMLRSTRHDLGETIAQLPLPFDNQAEKVRYSDLPTPTRELIQDLLSRVTDKIGDKEATKVTSALRGFMSGADLFNQSEVTAELSRLLSILA